MVEYIVIGILVLCVVGAYYIGKNYDNYEKELRKYWEDRYSELSKELESYKRWWNQISDDKK